MRNPFSKPKKITYHYCAVQQICGSPIHIWDGTVDSAEPLQTIDMPLARNEIAREKGCEPNAFIILSLTRL